jgi:hypothetical protein
MLILQYLNILLYLFQKRKDVYSAEKQTNGNNNPFRDSKRSYFSADFAAEQVLSVGGRITTLAQLYSTTSNCGINAVL